ncbi:MAG: hypothetical protein HY726_02660 [Candidatus Rokubacteria bacterium]|nr:hypothetical protein [Candidatus Rokubacteria bacterium]
MAEIAIEYEPRLVEEAVFLAARGRAAEGDLRRERDRLYEVHDPEEQEAGFRAVHAAWFERLGLGRQLELALEEQPSVAAKIGRCLVACARSGRDEGAELFVSPEDGGAGPRQRVVVLRLRPETLTVPERLRLLLRREFLHVADMLDPAFGYEPRLRAPALAPARQRLLSDRYRVLWDAFVDGRLGRLGWAPVTIRAERLEDFERAFPGLGERMEASFERFFGDGALTHAELAAFAADPQTALRGEAGVSQGR